MADPLTEKTLGSFTILHALKRGGMGEVLLGIKRGVGGFEKLAAIKTIRSDLKELEQLRDMFLDEARLVARISHPAVAPVYDFGEQDGTLFLIMEYVAGVRFHELAEWGLPPGIAARAVAEACRGLHAAHELRDRSGRALGVVHRDVSPDNLMLTFDGHVKVLDFGIALTKARKAAVTEFGIVKGKPPYLAPEQVRGDAVDRRTDIFSACAVLHELITGQQLFDGDSIYEVARAIQEGVIAAPSQLVNGVPDGLDEVVLRGLSRDPSGRYQTALDLAEALEAVANDSNSETLENYAPRALAVTRAKHHAWLEGLLSISGAFAVARGRASHILTIPGDIEPLELGSLNTGELSAEAPSTGEMVAPIMGRTGTMRAAVGAMIAVAVAFGVWFAMLAGDDSELATLAMDGAVAQTPVDATLAPVEKAEDAAPSIDATAHKVAADAGPRPKTPRDRKHSPRIKRDAAPGKIPPAVSTTHEGQGFLLLGSDPFSMIRIDGKNVGNTPKTRLPVSAGSHVIEFVSPATGAVIMRRKVVVKDGKLHRVVYP